MRTVVLHNGHLNVDANPDSGLHGEYGADGELEWIRDFQHSWLGPLLQAHGYTVKFTDGSGPAQDFTGDIFIADHYDGAGPTARYFNVAHYQPDSTPADANRLCALLAQEIAKTNYWSENEATVTINETKYYGFTYESQADAIIEHGNGPSSKDIMYTADFKQAHATAMLAAINAYFGDTPTPPAPVNPIDGVITKLSVIGDKTYETPVDIIGIRLLVQSAKADLGAK